MDYSGISNRAALLTGSLMQIHTEFLPFLEFLDKNISPKSFLEIGVSFGATYYVWCSLCRPGGIKLGIDLPNAEFGVPGVTRNEKDLDFAKHIFETFAPNSHILFKNSSNKSSVNWVSNKLEKEKKKLDFLFIDGDHTYEGVKKDYLNYKGFVRKGGVVAFHDIKDTDTHKELGCHVSKLWSEIRKKDSIEFCDSNYNWGGIGVLKV